jgi:hypothetical protein
VGCIIIMNGEPRDRMYAHLPVSRGDEFSGPTGMLAGNRENSMLYLTIFIRWGVESLYMTLLVNAR